MPLMKGHSPEVVSNNVKEMMKAGHPQKQAIAASLAKARKFKKMAKGGMVQSLDKGGMEDLEPLVADDVGPGGDNESMAEMDSKGPEDYVRSLGEIQQNGDYHPDEVANPAQQEEAKGFAAALRQMANRQVSQENYAMGGLVQDGPEGDERDSGARPLEGDELDGGMDSTSREDAEGHSVKPDGLEHPVMNDPSGMGLSEEAKKAIANKRKSRLYGSYNPKY